MQNQTTKCCPELLAPAGSTEALQAALRCGADAVYVGGTQYSARQNAGNFDLPALEEAARLCHLYGAKLHLAVNTLLLPQELEAFSRYMQAIASIGVDACIVQDLGAAAIIRQAIPEMPLHASTQLTIHSPEGARFAKEQGFCRVVAARELSRSEVQALCACDIEIEQFVHGALCMSVSGQCYLSAMIGGRSANRGRCAQACRLPFSASGHPEQAALSLKDLCLIPYAQQLIADGITSLKIEGRMKRPEYVAAAVLALRAALNGEQPDLSDLRAVFSRSGFTDGYYTGTRSQMFGKREKEDVTAAKAVLPRLAQTYQKLPDRIPLEITVTAISGQPVTATFSDPEGQTVTVTGAVPQPAQNRPTDSATLQRQFSKLGDTIYTLQGLTAVCDGTSMLPASAWNALRRAGTAAMDAARIQAHTPSYSVVPQSFHPLLHETPTPQKAPAFWVQLRTVPEDCSFWLQQERVAFLMLPLEQLLTAELPQADRARILLIPPRFTPNHAEQTLRQQLQILAQAGYQHLYCQNVAHLRLGKQLQFHCHGGTGLNLTNPLALSAYPMADATLSPELTLSQTRACAGSLPIGIYGYGYFPVMLMRNCPVREEVGCKSCTGSLIDRTNRTFAVQCQAGYTELYNAVPIWLADKQKQLTHLHHLILDVSQLPAQAQQQAVLHAYQTGDPNLPQAITRGLYFRGIQ